MELIDILDIIIIITIGLFFYRLIKKTEAFKILLGLLIVYALYFIALQTGLERTANILQKASEVFTLGIVLIFHPELRIALRKIGGIADIKVTEEKEVITSIEEAVFTLSKQKIGALIIIDHHQNLINHADNVVSIDAKVTTELLQTIFHPNTRLHDGAVIIHNHRLAYAGCKLPLTGAKRENFSHLGTRHLAAIENAERFGVIAIVVSEETGNVSVVTEEGLTRIKSSTMFKAFFNEDEEEKTWLAKILKNKKK